MNKTLIEWVKNPDGTQGYTWNPITGCLNGCSYCYARKLGNGRLKDVYLANTNTAFPDADSRLPTLEEARIIVKDPFYPRFWSERLSELQRGIDDTDYQTYIRRKPMGIFVCDMGELFGSWLPERWIHEVLETIADDSNSQHRFYLLTKQPQNLIKFSPFPENCWVGVTVTNKAMYPQALAGLNVIKAKVKYISFEPLLGAIPLLFSYAFDKNDIQWVIIGACTGTLPEMVSLCNRYPLGDLVVMRYGNKFTAQPRIEWVEEIVEACDKAGIPVFLKNNLLPMFQAKWSKEYDKEIWENEQLRQEMPVG